MTSAISKLSRSRRGKSPGKASPTQIGTDVVTEEDKRRMISEAAYYRALNRGFAFGDPVADWLEAEQEVAHQLQQ